MAFDDTITRDLQDEFDLFRRSPDQQSRENRATPANLAVLLDSLERLTAEMASRRAELSDWMPDAAIRHWDAEFAAWSGRLTAYQAAVAAAPPDDREAVLWTVTAPLLLGYYEGPDSGERRAIDAGTPFRLSDQLDVDEAWREERTQLLFDDLKKGAEVIVEVVSSAIDTVVIVGGVVVVGGFLWWLSNKGKQS